jgi:glycosyltransferase involved in cell wall biosynthesis
MLDPTAPDFSNTPISPLRPKYCYAPDNFYASPAVSIISPFYNTGPIFRETAQSVLKQSFQQWEWIIVNDDSTDEDSLAILAEYRDRDPRIRIIDQPSNLGPGAARNTAVAAARAEYIVNIDSDDLLEPTAIEKWIWFLTSYPEYAFVKGYSVGFGAQQYLWRNGFHSESAFLETNQTNPNGAIRKSVFQTVGGYDASVRAGFEDWDLWLRSASLKYWGSTIPEFLDWYRRRPNHNDRWADWDTGQRQITFQHSLRQKYAKLWDEGFPHVSPRPHLPCDILPSEMPFANLLVKARPRILLLLPWLTMGGSDKFNLDLIEQLVTRFDYEVSVATTQNGDVSWMPGFEGFTPDVFVLSNFLRLVDYPRFLRYLIQSRQIDTVLISHSYLGYLLLPYLRAYCPNVTFMDYLHIEEEYWKNGGYPRASLNQAHQIDLTVVSSEHLKRWMLHRGAIQTRVEVCTTNVNVDEWKPSQARREELRQTMNIDPATPVVLYAGRLVDQKQPKVFAEVMRDLAGQAHKFTALVAGDGPDRTWLENFLKTNGLAQVHLLGSVSNKQMHELMIISDIFFLPSQHEGISLAIYEAMSMGLVPVCADVGGQSELVTPECGFLIRHDATEQHAYVEALISLLQNTGMRQKMGQAARQRVCGHFRLEQMGDQMIELIRRANEAACNAARPNVPQEIGDEIATQVIEQTRLEQLADSLWIERQNILQRGLTKDTLQPYFWAWTAQRLKRTVRPIYYWLVRHGMTWLVPMRERLRGKVLGRLTSSKQTTLKS